jgi:hypothetical protein
LIYDKDVEILALKIYQRNGLGITFVDLIKEFRCSKGTAQRKLKNLCIEKIDNKGKKAPILFRAFKRTSPQQFYPYSMRAEIIEKWKEKKNRPFNPTGVNYLSEANHLSPTFPENRIQPARYLLEILYQFLYEPIYIHKLFLQTSIDPSYYKELDNEEKVEGNKAIQYEEIIGPLSSKRQVTFTINPNCTVMIYITCSRSPFKLENGEDISYIFSFLGQVRDRLLYLLRDPNERILSPLMDWKLNQCDVNKDIEINDMEQLTLPDVQLIGVNRVFRLYVKALEQRAYYRLEESKQVNHKISSGFENLLKMYSQVNEFNYHDPSYIH